MPSNEAAVPGHGPGQSAEAALAARGRAVYMANCIACHNPNPALPGSLGPEVLGASRDLLEARILRGGYPADYTPKRATRLMPPMPKLSGEIAGLSAFLEQSAAASSPGLP